MMKRRDVIKLVSLATGTAISAPLLSSLLTGCKKTEALHDSDYIPLFFNKKDFQFLQVIIDIILPKTDSPSATEVNVHKTIDIMLNEVYKPQDKNNYKKGFSSLTTHLNHFLKLDNAKQLEQLKQLNNSDDSINKLVKSAFLELKQQTIAYYLSTESVAKNHLNYLPIPGDYVPCISLEEVGGKAWAI